MLTMRPFSGKEELMLSAKIIWQICGEKEWLKAFAQHPKIGDLDSLAMKYAGNKEWSKGEQAGVNTASMEVLQALAKGNKEYEDKFGFIFIVCASGKSAVEMLELLQQRLPNKPNKEIHIAKDEQLKITHLRLEKLIDF